MWIDRPVMIWGAGLSLLLNVFLLGLIGGHLFAGRVAHGRNLDSGPVVQHSHVKTLPSDEKTKFQEAMASHRQTIRETRKTVRAARVAVEAEIAAPTFDRDKVAADFLALRTANLAAQEAVNEAVVDALSGLSASSREALVKRSEGPPARP